MAAASEPVKKSNISYFSTSTLPAVKSQTTTVPGENTQQAANLPPFEVLLQWLGFYHEQSGSWPTPPVWGEIAADKVIAAPTTTTDPAVTATTAPTPAPTATKVRPLKKLNSQSGLARPAPPKLAQEVSRERGYTASARITAAKATTLPGTLAGPEPAAGRTRPPLSFNSYDYQASVYYTAALEIAGAGPVARKISAGALLVLSSILAWSQHSFFKDKCLNSRCWMSLPLRRWSRELKMRKAGLSRYLDELQNAGLLIYGTLNDGILENSEVRLLFEEREKFALLTANNEDNAVAARVYKQRFTPGYIRIYRLAVTLSRPLPSFVPENTNTHQGAATPFKKSSDSKIADSQQARPNFRELNPDRPEQKQGLINLEKPLADTVPDKAGPVVVVDGYGSPTTPCTCCNYLNHDFKNYKNHDSHRGHDNRCDAVGVSVGGNSPAQTGSQSENIENGLTNRPIFVEPSAASLAGGLAQNLIKALEAGAGIVSPGGVSDPGFSEEVFTFLTATALFPGFSRSDGRQTLDEREALKFASSRLLTLPRVKEIYYEVLSLWTLGKCNKNPIGFLHNRLNKYLTGCGCVAGTGSVSPGFRRAPGAGLGLSTGSVLTSLDPLEVPSPSFNSGSEDETVLSINWLNSVQETELLADAQFGAGQDEANFSCDRNFIRLEQALSTLKKKVVESLSDRYRRPDFSRVVEVRDWKMRRSGKGEGKEEVIQIILEEPDAGAYPYFFSEGDRSLLRVVLSQGLTSVGLRKIDFQLIV